MGTWSHKILGNDTSCEVRERFIELYNNNHDTSYIIQTVIEEQKGNIDCDPTNVWLGLALICWECNCLEQKLLSRIKKIIETGEDIIFNLELDADEEFIQKRKIELEKFLQKISIPKTTARRRIKPPKEYKFHIQQGEIYRVKINSEFEIKILIVHSKHFKNKGEIRYVNLLDVKNEQVEGFFIPTKYYWPQNRNWSEFIFGGSSYSIEYNKNSKEAFMKNLTILKKLDYDLHIDFDRLTFNITWKNIDFNKPNEFKNFLFEMWKDDTNIDFRATTIGELIEHLNMKPE